MRGLAGLAAVLVACPALAQSNWSYDPAPAMAEAFCSARARGKSLQHSLDAFHAAGSAAWSGGIPAMLANTGEVRAAAQRALVLIRETCNWWMTD